MVGTAEDQKPVVVQLVRAAEETVDSLPDSRELDRTATQEELAQEARVALALEAVAQEAQVVKHSLSELVAAETDLQAALQDQHPQRHTRLVRILFPVVAGVLAVLLLVLDHSLTMEALRMLPTADLLMEHLA